VILRGLAVGELKSARASAVRRMLCAEKHRCVFGDLGREARSCGWRGSVARFPSSLAEAARLAAARGNRPPADWFASSFEPQRVLEVDSRTRVVGDDAHALAELELVARRQLDDGMLLAQPRDARGRRLEHEAAGSIRARIGGERLAARVEHRAPAAGRLTTVAWIVNSRSAFVAAPAATVARSWKTYVPTRCSVTRGRSSPHCHIVGVPPVDTTPARRPRARARSTAAWRNGTVALSTG
jgi:hypothetical protein